MSERTIVITVEGGIVQDVDGLPDGYSYEVRDYDIEGASGAGDFALQGVPDDGLHRDEDGREYFRS